MTVPLNKSIYPHYKRPLALLVLAFTLNTSFLFAELIECDGVWSNKPCEGQASKSLGSETQSEQLADENNNPASNNATSQAKLSAVAELETFVFDAKRKLKQDITISDVVEFCENQVCTLADCRSQVERRKLEITDLLTQLKNDEQAPSTEVEINDNRHNTNVVIIQEDNYHYGRPRPTSTRSGLSPDFKPGPFGRPPLIKSPTKRPLINPPT